MTEIRDALAITYVLPIKASESAAFGEFDAYIRWLAPLVELVIVDGSPPEVFAAHAAAWNRLARHVAPDPALVTPMGKVGGVLTGVALATNEHVVIADDDVRYDLDSLQRVGAALDDADVVRPQNYFQPMPWHARWDTARTLLNRVAGGDWPGTLGVRRSSLLATNGYDGNVMFENLELVRTVVAAGGREALLLDVLVARRPPETAGFLSQRVRQAYDEFARPHRLVAQLALLPATVIVARKFGWKGVLAEAAAFIALAEAGRRRAGGTRAFPRDTPLFAPLWVAERAACSWLAVASRIAFGGIRYRGTVLPHAATPMRELKRGLRPRAARQSLRGPRSTVPRRSV